MIVKGVKNLKSVKSVKNMKGVKSVKSVNYVKNVKGVNCVKSVKSVYSHSIQLHNVFLHDIVPLFLLFYVKCFCDPIEIFPEEMPLQM